MESHRPKKGGSVDVRATHPPVRRNSDLVRLYSEEDERESSGVESTGGRANETTNLIGRPEPIGAARSGPLDQVVAMVLHGADAGRIFRLGATTVFGRDAAADVSLNDSAVSREHARLTRSADGSFAIEDLGSSNGTFVDGIRVLRRQAIASGARIQFGPTQVLRFFVTDAVEAELYEQMYLASTRDALTQSFNRRYFEDRLEAELAYSARHKAPLGLLLIDVDHFKKVNDRYGHLLGDEVLRLVAGRVTALIRTEDLFARVGGEEFAVLVRGIPHEHAIQLAERVRQEIALDPFTLGGQSLPVTVSVGVATFPFAAPRPGRLSEALFSLADARLYKAKTEGRNKTIGE